MRILFLDLDTLRPDHLGCYGYHRNTSPNIDKIAAKGVRFNKYYCTDAPCLPSRSALLSGKYGIHNGAINHGGVHADPMHEGSERKFKNTFANSNLISLFRQAGYKTASVNSFAERHSSFWFNCSFNETYNNIGKSGGESAEEVLPDMLSWIERNAKEDNWLLHLNMWDAHTPYRAPVEYGNPFENEPISDWLNEEIIAEHQKVVGPHTAREISMYNDKSNPNLPRQLGKVTNYSEVKKLIDGYDTGIRYMDDHIGYILQAFEKQGITLDDLCVIVTSDHGENIGELGIYSEHATADEITCRIPMIIKWEFGMEGTVDNDIHGNIDLCPTISELLDVKKHEGWDGQSYANVITKGESQGRDHLIISQCAHVCQRSVRFGKWLYMRTYHDGYHLFPKEMLFDIENDPHEEHNVADSHPEVVREAVQLYLNWHDEMMETLPTATDPMWSILKEGGPFHAKGELKNYVERLRQTGREESAELLIQKHPREMR